MKKNITLLLFALLFVGCSSDDEAIKDKTETVKIDINVGETYDLPNGLYTIESAFDNFIVDVNTDGKIKGVHDGVSNVVLKSGHTTYNCEIKVTANTTFFVDLKYLIGFSKADIIKLYGEPTSIDKQNYYFNGLVFERRNIFSFDENNKVVVAITVFNSSRLSMVKNHLSDRYVLATSKDNSFFYVDSYDINTFKLGVMLEINGNEIALIYKYK